MDKVVITRKNRITIISINRPDVRNAVNYKTSKILEKAMLEFNLDNAQHIAIITGTGAENIPGEV